MLPAPSGNASWSTTLQYLVGKLRTRATLSKEAEVALLQLPYDPKVYEAPAYIIREGSTDFSNCSLVVAGYAFRQKLTVEGKRKILSFHMRGELLDLQNLFLKRSDHSVQAMTQLDTLNIERSALQQLILTEPSIGEAMWIDALVDASIYRDWITNVGQRDAMARIAHLLCEFTVRTRQAGLADQEVCQLPMTQEQIGDAVGLTSVHVNRTLKALQKPA